MTTAEVAQIVCRLLKVARLRTTTERALQMSIEEALTTAKIEFQREKALSERDRPDFMLADGAIVLEAKCRYPRKKIYRQLERYAEHDGVEALILITGTPLGLPATINGKPIYVLSAGMGMLGC